MKIIKKFSIPDLILVEPQVYRDDRGFFMESYSKPLYENMGIYPDFLQDNLVLSKKNTLRGMHFQMGAGQHKLISVIKGEIYDVAVDIREDSSTFGKWEGVLLDDQSKRQFFVPAGFAHGYLVLSSSSIVQYKVSPLYDPELEKGFQWNDEDIQIHWPIKAPILSERDKTAPSFKEYFLRSVRI